MSDTPSQTDASDATAVTPIAPEPATTLEEPFVPGTHLETTSSGSKERYDWKACSIQVALTIHPDDGDPKGRLITVAVWTHADAPLTRTVRRDELGTFPPVLRDALVELQRDLPNRERLAFERKRVSAQKAAREEREKREAAARRAKTTKKPEKPERPTTARATKEPTTTSPAKVVATTDTAADQAGLFF